MILDIIFVVVTLLAFFFGYKKGLIEIVVSYVRPFVAIALSIMLSSQCSKILSKFFTTMNGSVRFVIAFLLVVFISLLMMKLFTYLFELFLQKIKLNAFNQYGGASIYVLFAMIIYSSIIYVTDGLGVLPTKYTEGSMTYQYVKPLAPTFMNFVLKTVPYFHQQVREMIKPHS